MEKLAQWFSLKHMLDKNKEIHLAFILYRTSDHKSTFSTGETTWMTFLGWRGGHILQIY